MNYEVEFYAITQTYSLEPADFQGKTMSSNHLGLNYNVWHFSGPKVDALLTEANMITDQKQRLELYYQVAEIVLP